VRGISLAVVRAIEAGERPSLNYEQIIRLARVLGVEPSEIMLRAEKPRRRMTVVAAATTSAAPCAVPAVPDGRTAAQADAQSAGRPLIWDRTMTAAAPKTVYQSRSEPGAPMNFKPVTRKYRQNPELRGHSLGVCGGARGIGTAKGPQRWAKGAARALGRAALPSSYPSCRFRGCRQGASCCRHGVWLT
jgi:hypothetical protein